MGHIYADVELINGEDLLLSKRNIIGADEVKRMHLRVLVDMGAFMLTINENIQQQLQVPLLERRKAVLADGRILECDVVGPIELRFKNRKVICSAMVLTGDVEPLLGVIPMEEMDVLIHPQREELIVNPEHPYFAQLKLK
jgi:clan AA aspartic protease